MNPGYLNKSKTTDHKTICVSLIKLKSDLFSSETSRTFLVETQESILPTGWDLLSLSHYLCWYLRGHGFSSYLYDVGK